MKTATSTRRTYAVQVQRADGRWRCLARYASDAAAIAAAESEVCYGNWCGVRVRCGVDTIYKTVAADAPPRA